MSGSPHHDALKPVTSAAFWFGFILLTVLYYISAPHLPAIKQRAWLLTAISSGIMSLSSFPLFFEYAKSCGDLRSVSSSNLWTHVASRFFQAYLVADLTMGFVHYRSKVNLLTGWVHHAIYVFIVEYSLRMDWSHIFCLCAIMEVPTFALAIASIDARLRSDVFFAVSFFTTRILLHIVLCVSLFVDRDVVTGGSFGPGVIMACIFPLHAFWFSGCIKGFVKRANLSKTPVSHSDADPLSSVVKVTRYLDRTNTAAPSSAPSHSFTHAPRSSSVLSRRRSALRLAMRARWDQLGLWKAGGRLNEMQRRFRAALPARERVYEYVGLESSSARLAMIDERLGFRDRPSS
ncbi:hypothetical protein F5I97DRAFT_470844 [Phlebopus sp. FC_14]|nr:hypothetical protein F5I97DRAFT_470844 [Phlebopus sp. FC_14]